MDASRPIWTPARIAAATVLVPFAYVLVIGPERFYYESWGTWLLSPVIYTRFSPEPLKGWLLHGFLHSPAFNLAILAIPVLMLFAAALLLLWAIHKDSRRPAIASLLLSSGVFAVYHVLQPLGVSYIAR